jgi:hypothetical protein
LGVHEAIAKGKACTYLGKRSGAQHSVFSRKIIMMFLHATPCIRNARRIRKMHHRTGWNRRRHGPRQCGGEHFHALPDMRGERRCVTAKASA